jgi:hypothetical protein
VISTTGRWFVDLPSLQKSAILWAWKDIVDRLADDTSAAARGLQEKVFDKINSTLGESLTVKTFRDYLLASPWLLDASRSEFCYDTLRLGRNEDDCLDRMGNNEGSVLTVAKKFTDPKEQAATWKAKRPAVIFFDPCAIRMSAFGRNSGNEALIIHEALHGYPAVTDFNLQAALGLPGFLAPSTNISDYIHEHVTSHWPGLDQTTVHTCF